MNQVYFRQRYDERNWENRGGRSALTLMGLLFSATALLCGTWLLSQLIHGEHNL